MLTLNDGRTELWQWDTNRKLTVDADCSQVHFSNKLLGRSIDVDVVDGVVIIPDVLLQTDKALTVWAFVGTAEDGYTKISKTFKVNRRNKPADYVFTPPEQTTLGQIMERLDDLEAMQDPDAIKNAVDDYLANNPIQIDEKDPTVPAWAKQEAKPKYTATEVGAVATVNGVAPDENGNVEIETGEVTDEQVATAVSEYLSNNPDATIPDGSITEGKMAVELMDDIKYISRAAESESTVYPYSDSFVGTRKMAASITAALFNDVPLEKGGQLTAIEFATFTTAGNSNLYILEKVDGTIQTAALYKNVAITGAKTDVAALGITVSAGQYLAVQRRPDYFDVYWDETADTTIYYPSDTIGASVSVLSGQSGRVDVKFYIGTSESVQEVTIKEKVVELDERTTEVEQTVTNLSNLDTWVNRSVLHIGTSISDEKTIHSGNYLCTWFKEAMALLNCPNGTNTAESGKGADYHAANYDTLIAPYVANADYFTIEHYVNDDANSSDTANLEPDENGEYDTTTYYGAMAYIITRARQENMFVKIGLLSHWTSATIPTPIQNVAEKFGLPILNVGKLMGTSQQTVDTTMTIRGVAYSGSRTISKWFSTSSMYPNGDDLHPFNDKAQTKYASIYAGWLNSW